MRPLDLTTFRDEGLRKAIEAKIEGREIVAPATTDLPPAGTVIDALSRQ